MKNAFIKLFVALCVVSFCARYSSVAQTRRVVILSTNDVHSKIERTPMLSTAVRMCRDTVPTILVDAGDRWTGNVFSDRAEIPYYPIINIMNKIGYDVATLGNHEFDKGADYLAQMLGRCRFDVVCANIQSRDGAFPQLSPYKIVSLPDGAKVAFVGVVGNYTPKGHPVGDERNFESVAFTNPIDALNEWSSLGKEADALVALTHMGVERDREFAKQSTGYDLVVGGHSHDVVSDRDMDGRGYGVPIMQSGRYLNNVAVAELTFDGDSLVGVTTRIVPLGGYAPDPEIAALVDEYYDYPALRRSIGQAPVRLDKQGLANMMAEAFAQRTDAQIGVCNWGSVRIDMINKGSVAVSDVYNLQPFANTIVVARMRPADLERMIIAKYNDTVNVDESHSLDLILDTPYTIFTDRKGDAQSVVFPELKAGKYYNVAFPSYVFDNYSEVKYRTAKRTEILVTDAIFAYFDRHKPLNVDNVLRQEVRYLDEK